MSIPRKSFGTQLVTHSHGDEQKHETLVGNIGVARLILRLVGSTLGPFGMSKAVLKERGGNGENTILVTSDAASVLESMKMAHPVAELLKALAKAQKRENGDGAATAVIIACSLLRNAEALLKMGFHPSIISEGYRLAEEKATEVLQQRISIKVDPRDNETLGCIARSVMNSRIVASSAETLELFTSFVVRLTESMVDKKDNEKSLRSSSSWDLDNVRIIKKTGDSLLESELILDGFLVDDREVVHPNMPHEVSNASIALVDDLETKKLTSKSGVSPLENLKIETTDLDDYQGFLRSRAELAKSKADKLDAAGANVVLVKMGIDEVVEHYLSRHGILAVKRVKGEDLELIAKLTQGTVVGDADEISPDKLGKAASVKETKFGDDVRCILINGCEDQGGTASIVLRGSSRQELDEAERSLRTALKVIRKVIEDPRVVPSGGATELELAEMLKSYALTFSGKEQFAVQQYAKSLEALPIILAENAGLDAAETIMNLKLAHSKGSASWGIDSTQSRLADMKEAKILDPFIVKLDAIRGATELAVSILRISGLERSHRLKRKGDETTEKPDKEIEGERDYLSKNRSKTNVLTS